MQMTTIPRREQPEATDALYDTAPATLARVFGRRAIEQIRTGRDPYTAARLAATYAFQATPDLRIREATH